MTILVTGGAGYIGSHMTLELIGQGEQVVILDDLSSGTPAAIPPEAVFIQGNVGDSGLVRGVLADHGIDAIVHFAGSIVVPESVADPLKYYHNNVANSLSLIASAVGAGVKHFIFSSTAAVYGIPENNPISEDAQEAPISPYGASKLMTERMLADTASAHGLGYAALRYFNVAGADPLGRTGQSTPTATHLIKIACQAALGQRDYLEVFGKDYETPDGTCIRDYIHVSDLAAAHWSALEYLRAGKPSDIFNCGYGRGYSVLEVIEAVNRVAGTTIDARDASRRAGDPAALISDPTRIHAALDWQPRHENLDTIVKHALDWEKKLAVEKQP